MGLLSFLFRPKNPLDTLGLRAVELKALAGDHRAAAAETKAVRERLGDVAAVRYLECLVYHEAAGAPPEALDPLLRGVIDGGFELTGPIARGDWDTDERHLAVIRAERPELEELYLVLAAATARVAGRELPADLAAPEIASRS